MTWSKTFYGKRLFTYSMLVLGLLFSQVFLPLLDKEEVFPFFSWKLFTNQEPLDTLYQIELLDVAGAPLCLVPDCPGTSLKNTDVYFQIRNLGKLALKNTASNDFLMVQQAFESRISHQVPHAVGYRVFKTHIRLLEYWKDKKILQKTLIYEKAAKNP